MILVSALWFGGCAPAPKRVFVDVSRLTVSEKSTEISLTVPININKDLPISGQLIGRAPRLLQEQAGLELWDQARATLSENRQRSFDRLKRDLERKYIGESRAKAIEAQRASELLDEADWSLVLEQTRDLMERYAGQKTELNAELAGLIGFPDEGQPPQRRVREEVFVQQRRDKVARLREEVAEIEARFKTELRSILNSYEKARHDRILQMIESDYAGDLQAIARANQEAEKAIQQVVGQVNSSVPQLRVQLAELSTARVSGKSAQSVYPRFGPETVDMGLSRADLEKYVNVFIKSRGYRLEKSKNSEDVTEEFKSWLKKNAVIR